MFRLLQNLISNQTGSRNNRRQRGNAAKRPTTKLAVESLEKREVPSAVNVFAASAVAPNAEWTVVTSPGGSSVKEYFSSTNTTYSSPGTIPGTIKQLSAGKTYFDSGDAVFARDANNNVWEFYRDGTSLSAPVKIATGVIDISGSALSADTFFGVDTTHSVNEYKAYLGLTQTAVTPLGTPWGGAQASRVSAALDGSTLKEAVFANFGGNLCEHTAWAGWSIVSGLSGTVTDFSASQIQGDTVFAVNNSALVEYVGKGGGINMPLSYTSSTIVSSGVTQVSAGMDANGHAAAFTLSTGGSVDEYFYEQCPLPPYPGAWFKKHITDVCPIFQVGLDASQVQSDKVYYMYE